MQCYDWENCHCAKAHEMSTSSWATSDSGFGLHSHLPCCSGKNEMNVTEQLLISERFVPLLCDVVLTNHCTILVIYSINWQSECTAFDRKNISTALVLCPRLLCQCMQSVSQCLGTVNVDWLLMFYFLLNSLLKHSQACCYFHVCFEIAGDICTIEQIHQLLCHKLIGI